VRGPGFWPGPLPFPGASVRAVEPALNPVLAPLAGLLGTWRGTGEGEYPTIEPFRYHEEVTFGHVGKPFLSYGQRTRHADTDVPLHAESGYWRVVADGRLEVVLVHPTGILESSEGTVAEGVIELRSVAVLQSATAVSVTAVHRRFRLAGDELGYDLAMAAVGQPLTHHLRAVLRRVG
jgi:hypothetical protein